MPQLDGPHTICLGLTEVLDRYEVEYLIASEVPAFALWRRASDRRRRLRGIWGRTTRPCDAKLVQFQVTMGAPYVFRTSPLRGEVSGK